MTGTSWTHVLMGLLVVLSAEEIRDMSIAGLWTLNSELSDRAESTGSSVTANRLRSFRDQANSSSETSDLKSAWALLGELLEPNEHLTVAPSQNGLITIVDGRGISRAYHTSGDPELQEFGAGLAETRTFWEGKRLRQEIRLGEAFRLVRTYQSAPDRDRLIETIAVEHAQSPAGRPLIRVYESDRVR